MSKKPEDARLVEAVHAAFYREGHTLNHIAQSLGVSVDQVRRLRDAYWSLES